MLKCKFIPILLCMPILAGCASSDSEKTSDKIKVVCTVFPEYDWTREIIGEANNNIDLELIADNGTDFHSYQPSTEDIVTVSSCDVLIYVGGESDKWIEDALKSSANSDMQVVKLTDIVESVLLDEPETHEDEHEEHEEEHSFDEHVWLSLKNSVLFCKGIADALAAADSENADVYKANSEDYIAKLNDIDSKFQEELSNAKRKSVLFGDRFPFIYLIEDYDITYYAAFPGCSSETDASFDTVVELAKEADSEGLTAILTIEGSDCNIADAIISNTKNKNLDILTLDSMQSVSREDIEGGKTYLSVMKKNIDVLMEALN